MELVSIKNDDFDLDFSPAKIQDSTVPWIQFKRPAKREIFFMISLIMMIFMISTSVIMDAEKMNGHGWKNNRATRIFCTFLACSLSRQESEITAYISTATNNGSLFLGSLVD